MRPRFQREAVCETLDEHAVDILGRVVHSIQGVSLDKAWPAWNALVETISRLLLPENRDRLKLVTHCINLRLAEPLSKVTSTSKRFQRTKNIALTDTNVLSIIGLNLPMPRLVNVPYNSGLPPSP